MMISLISLILHASSSVQLRSLFIEHCGSRPRTQTGLLPFSVLSCFDSSGCCWIILVSFAFLLHACCDVAPAEDFQRSQIVPEAAAGTVTTTGQLWQSTDPLLRDMGDTHTERHHTHLDRKKKLHCQAWWHATHTISHVKPPPHGILTCWSVSLCVQYKPWKHCEIIKSLIYCYPHWEIIKDITTISFPVTFT